MLNELKKLFVYGEIDSSKNIVVSNIKRQKADNSVDNAIVGSPGDDKRSVEGEFPVSPQACDILQTVRNLA